MGGCWNKSWSPSPAFSLPPSLDALKGHLDPLWIEEALGYAGTASIRRR